MCKLKKKIIIMFYDLDRNAGIQSVIHYWVSVLNSEYDVEILLAKDPVCERLHNVTYKRITLFDHSDQHTFFRSIDYILSFVFMRKNKNARYIDFGTYCWIFFPFIYAFRHFGVTYNARNALILRLARLISKKRTIVCLTDETASKVREKFGFDNIRKLVNYFKFNEFDEGGVEVKLDKIFMGGRASRQKGFDRVLSKDTSLEIDFYSDNAGNYNNIVNSNINVHDRLATIDEMKMYKYCFMPSRYEGLPLLAIEMILNGTIVCHSGCEGMQEVFSEFYSIYKIDFDSCDFDKKFSRKENEMESKFILLRKSVKERFVVDDRFSLNRFKLVFDV